MSSPFVIEDESNEYAALAENATAAVTRISYDQVANFYNTLAVKSGFPVKIDKQHAGKVSGELVKRGLKLNVDFKAAGVDGSKGQAVFVTRLTNTEAVVTPKTRTRKPKAEVAPVAAPPIPPADEVEQLA